MLGNLSALFNRILGRSAEDAGLPQDDRRVWVRFPCDLDASYRPANGHESVCLSARVRDLSRGGISLVVNRRFDPGVHLSIELPTGDGNEAFTMLACVVRISSFAAGEWLLGCSFAGELTDSDLEPLGARKLRTKPDDQRAWERFTCDVQASYQITRAQDPARRNAHVVNLSASGVGLRVNEAIDVGTLLNLELRGRSEESTLAILACVVRTNPQANQEWVLGCNFISEINEDDFQQLVGK